MSARPKVSRHANVLKTAKSFNSFTHDRYIVLAGNDQAEEDNFYEISI